MFAGPSHLRDVTCGGDMPVITGVRSATDEAARSVVILSLHTQSKPAAGPTQAQVSIYSTEIKLYL